jgi:hypothetical protein
MVGRKGERGEMNAPHHVRHASTTAMAQATQAHAPGTPTQPPIECAVVPFNGEQHPQQLYLAPRELGHAPPPTHPCPHQRSC